MKVKVTTCEYKKIYILGKEYKGLEEVLNDIGYENVLQIIPCSCGEGLAYYTVIYKESED